ncbi:Ser/Thr protein kinase RdoA involved in Cpx stress response, MazF antagonist [Aliiroseovarius sediminilitoris]|uniref:Ser/Thr protein kinase RdoA involved in Cpx stress response, MazF antagonist n=1 Tax=Aliiroseovarius sediminilitoris TaxID=1173584 RepID=A0A1I0MKN1_9RHOB|nr:phosphotransferase [Aliiroseovarius sediminilitoris]SEV88726.1 Ser/Thr protein kinase RdoA involved in Cpx stress response, MazF antagonist [Aliiroseovarius sediminilitoris]
MSALKQALAAWDAKDIRMIKNRENVVHEVRIDGRPAALRLHRPGYQSKASIQSELDWMAGLASAGMRVPAPIPMRSGDTVADLGAGQIATVVSWVDGAPIGEGGVPLPGTEVDQVALYHCVGRELATLHNLTDAMILPQGFSRHRWDIPGLLGDNPFWGRFWESPALTEGERALILRARAVAHDMVTAFAEDGADFGLIHADALRENIFVKDGELTLIDFDDAGFGFRIYDLAVMMTQNEDEPAADAIRDAAIAGYRTLRSFPHDAEALLPLFVMIRRFASMGWAVPRNPPDGPAVRDYAQKAVRAARTFLRA